MHLEVFQLRGSPHDGAIASKAGGAIGTEVGIDTVSLNENRRRRSAVFGMPAHRGGQTKYFNAPDDASLGSIHGEDAQRSIALGRRGEPNFVPHDNGR